jgi:hypothetical protein
MQYAHLPNTIFAYLRTSVALMFNYSIQFNSYLFTYKLNSPKAQLQTENELRQEQKQNKHKKQANLYHLNNNNSISTNQSYH